MLASCFRVAPSQALTNQAALRSTSRSLPSHCRVAPSSSAWRLQLPATRRRMSALVASHDSPLAVVQRQLELYNARDLDAFMAVFAPDVRVVNADTGETIATSAAELRPRYEAR